MRRVGLFVVLFAGVLLSAQSSPRDRANVGPAANPTSGSATLDFLDAGTVWFGNGTAALPSLAFGSDQNTGFYSSAANQVGISTNGVRSFVAVANGLLYGTTDNVLLSLNASAGSCLSYSSASSICSGASLVQVNGNNGFNINTANSPLQLAGVTILVSTTPTIASGFGSSPSVTAGKAYAFRVDVGTGGVATTGVIALGATATNGWNCSCTDITTHVGTCQQTASTTTTASFGQFVSAGTAQAWVASDVLAISCVGY